MTNNKLKIGISSRALFNLEKENEIYEQQGIEQYIQYQLSHENEILKPGVAFNLVRKLSGLMERIEQQSTLYKKDTESKVDKQSKKDTESKVDGLDKIESEDTKAGKEQQSGVDTETPINQQVDKQSILSSEDGVASKTPINQLEDGLAKAEQHNNEIEFILISRSCPDISIRIFNSIEYYKLPITRGIFTGGKSTIPYIKELNVDLYLSANREEVERVKLHNIAAGLVINNNSLKQQSDDNGEVHIAFDCDCVLFGSESEDIYRSHGLKAFEENEISKRNIPLEGGTFKSLLIKLAAIQSYFDYDNSPLRIAICTARGAVCSQRVINTFRSWNLRVNEAFFLNGLDKSQVLQAFNADIFFDDSLKNIESTSQVVPSVQVL